MMRFRSALRAALPILAASLLLIPSARAAEAVDPLRPAMEAAIQRVKPSLVRIMVVWTDYREGREIKREQSGSGFVVDARGYVVTNHHVAGHAARATCVFSDNEEVEAVLVGADPLTDIAVLKLAGDGTRRFPAVEWGDSSAAAVGDTVLAMGSPLALSQSVTRGIVSNVKMTTPRAFASDEEFQLDGEDVGALVRWLAHDAQIFPGNSGGPLVDMDGRVIGVNEISYGLSGAIPGALARDVADRIIAAGGVRRAWVGLELQPLLKGAAPARGVLIAGVVPGSPASRAGVQAQDLLLALDGKELTVRFDEELPLLNQFIVSLPIGKEVEARVLRSGREQAFKIVTEEREAADFRQTELKPWGMTAKDVSRKAEREMRLEEPGGVLVATVRPGGPCGEAKPAVERDDVLRSVSGKPVANVAALSALTRELTKKGGEPVPVPVEFERRGERFLTVVKVGVWERDDRSAEAHKAWLPVAVQVITRELAASLGDPATTGVRLTRVYKHGTAEAAGLKAGDLVLAVDGDKIQAAQAGDEEVFEARLRQAHAGDKPVFSIVRDGKPLKIAAELVASPEAEREMEKYRDEEFEFTARDLSFFDRVREGLPEGASGAIVTEVKSGGWAALGLLHGNDVIQFVNDEPVVDAAALKARMKALGKLKSKYAVFRVRRGIHSRSLQLEPDWDKDVRRTGDKR
jgi:serine protease Do